MDVEIVGESAEETSTYAQCVALLHAVIGKLLISGYRRHAVDTLLAPNGLTSIRHHYTAGEWVLTRTRPGTPTKTEKWTIRQALPPADDVIAHITSD